MTPRLAALLKAVMLHRFRLPGGEIHSQLKELNGNSRPHSLSVTLNPWISRLNLHHVQAAVMMTMIHTSPWACVPAALSSTI
jgi:hypothetical protein